MAGPAVEVPRTAESAPAREAWPDTLRVVVIAGVIAMHAATAYVVDVGWYYEERTSSEAWQIALTVPAFLGGLFALGPLFFVAGWLSAPSLARRGPRGFAGARLLRLGVPLLVFTFLVDPVADYIGHHAMGEPASLLDYLTNATGARDTGPMWFVAVILLFSLGYAGWRSRRPTSSAPMEPRTWHVVAAIGAIALLSFVLVQPQVGPVAAGWRPLPPGGLGRRAALARHLASRGGHPLGLDRPRGARGPARTRRLRAGR